MWKIIGENMKPENDTEGRLTLGEREGGRERAVSRIYEQAHNTK